MERQRQQARRRLGIGISGPCTFRNCDEADPLALHRSTEGVLCYEHQALQQNRPLLEKHHPAKREFEPEFTVPTFGNDHRVVTVMSNHWVNDIKSVKSSAMRISLARLCGLFDVLRQLVEKYAGFLDRIRLVFVWLDETRPEWEQEFERWRKSMDQRDT